jgi:two-component system CheB/CheR fusion protein
VLERLNTASKTGQKVIENGDFLVAIGASAGGLEAIHEFFDNLSGDTGLSFVIIQHLSPDYKSLLVELVGKHTQMGVYEAEDGMPIEKNSVYVIPNKKLLTVRKGKLQLLEKSAVKGPNTAIDSFLYTLAEEKGKQAIAIILSGTGTDGTKGIEKIKQAGGMVMVQDPVTAKFDGMPNSAIGSENVDFILPPELMPAEIYEYVKIKLPGDPKDTEFEDHLLADIFALVHHSTGWDFNFYKKPTIFRRIQKRMITGGFKKVEDYVQHLHNNADECRELSNDFLIGVTKFFRDKAAYEVLEKEVFPELFKTKANGDFVKVWVSACSTGEEAYSLAILLDVFLNKINKIVNVKIFATDIDPRAIEVAGKGIYSLQIENDIEPQILNKYFTREGNNYVVIPSIRKQIVFAAHNLLKDPPFIKSDLISCRNMLIYMDASLQKKVLSNFHFSLNTRGFLFLGSSETAGNLKNEMEEISSRWKIYQKVATGNNGKSNYSYSGGYPANAVTAEKGQKKTAKKVVNKSLADSFKEALSDDFGFAGIYLDSNYEIKEAVGNFRKYLFLPDKLVSLNVLKMVPRDVSALLGASLRQSLKEGKKVALRNVRFTEDDKKKCINILIKPPTEESQFYLLVLGEGDEKTDGLNTIHPIPDSHSDDNYLVVSELEAELKETRLNLQTAIEELETTNEELQSSNEELLSSNEELQSSNEELQSLNEELHTLNTEHQVKIRELIELNNDLDNYFRTTDLGQIFLDEKLCIRKFNTAATRMINVIETDVGRPINHISTNIRHENLLADIQAVVRAKQMIEKEIVLSNGTNCLLRITPYLMPDKRPNGVVITFIDISALKDLDNIIKGVFNSNLSAIMAFRSVRNVSQEIIDFKWLTANHAAETLLGKKSLHEDKLLKVEFSSFVESGYFDKLVAVVETGKALHSEYTETINGVEKHFEVVAVKMTDGVVITFSDVTDRKEAEIRLRRNFNELTITKEKLRKLNSDLESIVKERTKELSESEERFKLVSKATNDAIWDWNLTNNEVWWSDSFTAMLGYEKNREVEKRQFWINKIHDADKEVVKDSIYDVINNSGDSWSADYRILKADGNYADVFDRGFLLKDEYGTPYRMVGTLMDVTKLRKAEEEVEFSNDQRRFLAETVPLIVWTASPIGKLNFLNQHFTNYTGLQLSDGLGSGWKKVIFEEDFLLLQKAFKEAITEKQDFSIEVRLLKHDSSFRWHLLRARAKKDKDNKLMMWVGTLTDIHEQKLATQILERKVADRTQELRVAVRELEMSNNNLQQFAYIASHDLKEPLRKIHMFSSEIKTRFLSDADTKAQSHIDKVIKSSVRLTKLINDLLTFSSISSNNQFQKTSLQKLIEEVLSDLELVIHEKEVQLDIAPLPAIDAIPSQMRQVFQNLISNAVKFSRKGIKPVIEITCEKVAEKAIESKLAESGSFLRIQIKDNGIGFSEQHIDKIFMIFQRLHGRNDFEGTGIGLAIVKSIIDKHQGLITARSVEDQGSTFTIVLPVKQLQEEKAVVS